jgi:PAS domain S-box-containing protein
MNMVLVASDITEQKLTETKLQESEEKFRNLAEQSPNMIFIHDGDRVVYTNHRCEEVTGYTKEHFQSPEFHLLSLVAPEDRADLSGYFRKHLDGREVPPYSYTLLTADRRRVDVMITSKLIDFEGKRAILGIVADITEIKKAEARLKESEEKFRNLAQQSPNMIFINHEGRVVYANRRCAEITGYTIEELTSQDFDFLTLMAEREHGSIMEKFQAHLKGEEVPPYVNTVVTKHGREIDTLITTKLITYENGHAILGIITDVSELKQTEARLRESEEKFRNLAEQSPNMIFIEQAGRIVYANQRCEELIGYPRSQFYDPRFDFTMCIAERDKEAVIRSIQATYEGKEAPLHTYELITREGGRIHALISTKSIQYENRPAVLGIVTDITELKRTESRLRESEEKIRAIVDSSPMGIYLFRFEPPDRLVFIDFNPTADRISVTDLPGLIGKSLEEAFPTVAGTDIPERFLEVCQTGRPYRIDQVDYKRGRTTGAYEVHAFRASENQLVVMFSDISERIAKDRKIRESLKEKEILLKEIHHRVKNNMQVISSLLRLQSNTVRDVDLLTILRESQERVRSMALVYEKLYQSTDLVHIDFRDYLQGLALSLQMAYSGSHRKVKMTFLMQPLFLGIDLAVPCGLIINELITNVYKHAFPPRWKGKAELRIGMRKTPSQRIEITVRDNGVGLPKRLDLHTTESFGLYLVRILAQDQIGGTVQLLRGKGSTVRIDFPMQWSDEHRLKVESKKK